jgi:hypothetical protein
MTKRENPMSRPIHFNGAEYASREAMPPAVQAAFDQYRQAQENELLNELAEAEHPAAPAWGGAPAAGGVPVPVEFDPVTSLGPATAVYAPQGIRLPSFGPPRADALVVYRDGFGFRLGQAVHAWRWETIAVIQSNVWFSGRAHLNYEYTLTTDSGEHVILDSEIKNVDDALEDIKHAVVQRRLPAVHQAYDAGQPLTCGPVTIHKQNGLTLDGKLYAWATIIDIKVDRGSFIVTERTNKQHAARAKDIPNLELLGELIGLKFNQAMLAYY